MNNYPLGAANDPIAPYNEKTKIIEVTISQCLSSVQKIEVPENFDESDNKSLEEIVREQIVLPSDCLEIDGYYNWAVDDFCVI